MLVFIKYLGIISCTVYAYVRLFNSSLTKKQIVSLVVFPFILSAFLAVIEDFYPYASTFLLIAISFIFLTQDLQTPLELSLIVSILSYGISYITFSLSATVIVGVAIFIIQLSSDYNHMISQLTAAILQCFMTFLLFRNNRLRKGMPILTNKSNRHPLMAASVLLLTSALILNVAPENPIYLIFLLFIFFLALFIYYFWRTSITKAYLDRLKDRELADLNNELEGKESYIRKLEEENRELAKIIHGDNKLIPAMELAVRTFLEEDTGSDTAHTRKGEELLKDLERLSQDRKGILKKQDAKCQSIPATGISSIDSLLSYIQQKAFGLDVTFIAAISCDMTPITETYLSESELNTLLADLLENALIATQYNCSHHMLLQIDYLEKAYAISVYDSGIPFSKEVLVNLGLRNYTTHKEDGGSGIGLVSTFDLIQKCSASLVIDEYMTGSGIYSKKLSIVFNKLGQYNLFTYRSKKEVDYLKQRTDLIVSEKIAAGTSPHQSTER